MIGILHIFLVVVLLILIVLAVGHLSLWTLEDSDSGIDPYLMPPDNPPKLPD